MAFLSVLLSLVAREVGTIAQAIFGWSVTALFGQLSSAKRAALSVAIFLSLLWMLLVVGVFVPAVAAWSLAALPVHEWVGDGVIRIATIVLAVVIPAGVGLITRWVAPSRTRRVGTWKMMLHGYPLTLGYGLSCLVTAVTVPVIKCLSLIRRWADDHIYVQAFENEYDATLDELETACKAAGAEITRRPVPRAMGISTRIVRWFARGALDAIVQADPLMLKGKNVELYLYPADLLLRGDPKTTARVRARMAVSRLEQHAFLVASKEAQRMQGELGQESRELEAHELAVGQVASHLVHIQKELETTYVPYDEWVTLDRLLVRLRLAAEGGGSRPARAS